MSKTDDFIKSEISSIKTKNLKPRYYPGSSRMDQKLWVEGGLTFGVDGFRYGSLDFAWYIKDKNWIDPLTGRETKNRPVVVVEGSDCLNTRSWGNAQIQRLHHPLGGFLSGLCSIYYLREGEHPIRPELFGVASHINKKYRERNTLPSFLIITYFSELKKLVETIDKHGAPSPQYEEIVNNINNNMEKNFDSFLKKFSSWKEYLESRAIIKTKDGKFVKYLGPRKRSLVDSSQRMGHIILGEAFTSRFLLEKSNLFNPNQDIFYYFFPLLTKKEIEEIDEKLKHDKEWRLLRRKTNPWRIITLDCLSGVEKEIESMIQNKFRVVNLNKYKKEWGDTKKYIANKLKIGDYRIIDEIQSIPTITYRRL